MTLRTRIAPSPTGDLHLGTARTALFNWLYAHHHKGQFFIRIEDTDRARSTQEAVDVILKGLKWLGLEAEDPPVFQSNQQARHVEVAHKLLEKEHAYYCTCSPEVIEKMREEARQKGLPPKYNGTCRTQNRTHGVLRFKMPQTGTTLLKDLVQGDISVENNLFDDFVILRTDQTPTYMLSVVVDDHDMEITHIIRGDDHINNTFKQIHLYHALEWLLSQFAHIPLIHGEDGAKFSKRHGAPAVTSYPEQGFLSEALFNYLLRLGWSHGDQEFFSKEEAISLFDLKALNKSAARFDMKKLLFVNAHYMRQKQPEGLLKETTPFLEKSLSRPLNQTEEDRLLKGLTSLIQRCETLVELAHAALIYCDIDLTPDSEAASLLTAEAKALLADFLKTLENVSGWNKDSLDATIKTFVSEKEIKMPQLGKPLRVALTGRTNAPGLGDILSVLGQEEATKRLQSAL